MVGGIVAGCVSSENSKDERGADQTTARGIIGPDLAPQSKSIRTVQLYREGNETNLPVVARNSGESLTLAFDLMAEEGRPLSISFHHADRTWTRDLSPNQVLESYHDDRLVDYQSSRGTQTPYVHYTYQFPNDDIRFRLSGNYILRVTEQGRRDSVLFERPFFISDRTGQLRADLEALPISGERQAALRPVARYDPPSAFKGSTFGYAACFVRNGHLADARCQTQPRLVQGAAVDFELERDRAFRATTADYTVDLGDLRAGGDIERSDRTASPIRVLLEPDYAGFSDGDFDASLNGQIVVDGAVRGRAEPAVTAEYVETTFAFVPPDEQSLAGGVVVAGSFAGMDPDQGVDMQWQPGRERYEGAVLLKQGRYQYFYQSPDDRLDRAARNAQARRSNAYTTFLYYRDSGEGTDRLVQVRTFGRSGK